MKGSSSEQRLNLDDGLTTGHVGISRCSNQILTYCAGIDSCSKSREESQASASRATKTLSDTKKAAICCLEHADNDQRSLVYYAKRRRLQWVSKLIASMAGV